MSLAGVTHASTKDIVLDRLTQTPAAITQAPASTDAMAVSVLVESPDGSLTPRSTQTLFRTGERLRIKVLASRLGKISIHNTTPAGTTNLVWSGEVAPGQETISPRMVLAGQSGEDKLHVVFEPTELPQGILGWVNNWLSDVRGNASKDVRLDTQSTAQTTYVLNPAGQGLVSTVRIVHVR